LDTIRSLFERSAESRKMVAMTSQSSEVDSRPSLWRDPSYHAMNLTQFLGAFNDNLFKQMVLLICVDYARGAGHGRDYQSVAGFLFALPFVLFSGFAGFLADRVSKRRIVVTMKVAEIGVMAGGFLAFHALSGQLFWLIVVLFAMGTHSAFFGPSKYGILPELFRERDLSRVNGMIQMTTFLSIIFGMTLAGLIKEWYGDRLWVASEMCMGIAVVGTLTSLWVRRTPVAHPGLPFTRSALLMSSETWKMLRNDRPLLLTLLISSLFWFIGGVIQFLVNDFGKLQLRYGDGRTSVIVASIAIGIMLGCLWAGQRSKGPIGYGFVTLGAWGIVICLLGLAFLGAIEGSLISAHGSAAAAVSPSPPQDVPVKPVPAGGMGSTSVGQGEPLSAMLVPSSPFEWMVRGLLLATGIFAGCFIVPLATFMQIRPPADKKGRMMGAMNLFQWIAILIAAVFYFQAVNLCIHFEVRRSWIFAMSALVMLPVALFFRPQHGEHA
jgi:MFS family permease